MEEKRDCRSIPRIRPYLISRRRRIPILNYVDRLYLASYVEAPDANTLFPYPEPPAPRSPSKRSQRAVDGPTQVLGSHGRKQPFYFTVDDTLLYNAFHHDFGPLHIGHLYRFALQFHEILGAKENKDRPVVFWSRADPRSKFIFPLQIDPVSQNKVLTTDNRPRQCLLLASMLHGSHPVLASSPGPGPSRPG